MPKLYELRGVCEATKPDIICIVETWVDDSVSDNDLSISNYQLFRLDRNRHGGGIAIYIHIFFHVVILKGGPFALDFNCITVIILLMPFLSPTIISCLYFCTTLQIVNAANFSGFVEYFCNANTPMSKITVSSHTYVSPSGTASLLDVALKQCTIIPPLSTAGISLILKWKMKAATLCKSSFIVRATMKKPAE